MKYVKILGLAAVAAMALMAFAGSASATTLCKESKTTGDCASPYGPETFLEASVETSALLKTAGGTTIDTCSAGKVAGKTGAKEKGAGSTTETVSGTVSELTFESCTSTTKVLAPGTLEIHQIAGSNNGTVTSSGAEVTINFLGVSCVFTTSATDIGTLTGGKPATFDINGTIPSHTGGLCPASGVWSGSYLVTKVGTEEGSKATLDVAAG